MRPPSTILILFLGMVAASVPVVAQERVGGQPNHEAPDALTPLLGKAGLLEPRVAPIGSDSLGKSIPVRVVGGRPATGGGLSSVKVIRLPGNSAVPTEYVAADVTRLSVDDRVFVYVPKARALMPLVGDSPGGVQPSLPAARSTVPRTGNGPSNLGMGRGGGPGAGPGSPGGGGPGAGAGSPGGGGPGAGAGSPGGGGGGGGVSGRGGEFGGDRPSTLGSSSGSGGVVGGSPSAGAGNPGQPSRGRTGGVPEMEADYPNALGNGRQRPGNRANPGRLNGAPVGGNPPSSGRRPVGEGLTDRQRPDVSPPISMGQTPTFRLVETSAGGPSPAPRSAAGSAGETPTPTPAQAIVPTPVRGAGAAASRTTRSDPASPNAVAFVIHRRPHPGSADNRDQQLYVNDVWVAAIPDGERVQITLPSRTDKTYQVRLKLLDSPGGGETHSIRAKAGDEVEIETDMQPGDGDPCRIVKARPR